MPHPGLHDPALSDAILQAVGALVVVLDRDGRVVRFNDACVAATGFPREEVLGRPFFERLVPEEQRELVRGVFLRLRSGNFPSRYENDWLRKDGSRVTIAWSNTCTLDANGAVELVVGTGQDLSAQRRAEASLRAIVENTPNVAIQIYDREARITLWNGASTRLYGWTAEQTVGRPAAETLLAACGAADLHDAISAIERTGLPVGPALFPVRHRAGHEVLPLSTLFAIPGPDGGRQFVCMDIDMTSSARLEEALRVAAGAGAGEGLFFALTRELARLTGCRYALAAVIEGGDKAVARALVVDGRDGGPLQYPLAGTPCADVMSGKVCRFPSGVAELFPDDKLLVEMGVQSYAGTALRGSDGRALGVLVVLNDRPTELTPQTDALMELFGARLGAELEREAAEAAIRSLNVELERRVAERTAALDASNAELESFSYSVSHDLRAPLRAVTGFAQALEEDFGARLPDEGRLLLGRIQAAGGRMGRLIDDLLELSRITRQSLRLEEVDLSALAEEVGGELGAATKGRRVELTVEPGLRVRADPGLLRIVLVNLLSNAWKFTARCPTAHVRVGRDVREGRRWICVRDDGAGFDERYAERLFGAFQRLHSAAEFEGTGIGLATVARILRRHGGEIEARGVVGAGATFCFHFPPPRGTS